MSKTSSDSDYYYVDVNSSYKYVIFSNKGENKQATSVLTIHTVSIMPFMTPQKVSGLTRLSRPSTFRVLRATRNFILQLTARSKKVNTFLLKLPTNSQRQHIKQFMFQTMTGSRLQRFMQLLTTTMPMKEQLSLHKPR